MRNTLHHSTAISTPARMAMLSGLVSLTAACGHSGSLPGASAGATQAQLRALTVAGVAAQADPPLAAMRRAALDAPSDLDAQARFAGGLARAGEPALAEDVVTASLSRSPDHAGLTVQLARMRLRGGQPEVALALFDRAAQLRPGADAEEGRGIALDMLGRHEEAQTAYRAALALAPTQVSAQNNLAMSLMLTGRAAEAVALLEPLSRRMDAPARVANNLAVARSMAGDAPRMDTSADPRQVQQMASNLRATVGVAAAQPAPREQFAAAEPGRGATTPLFPLDAGSRASFAAAATPAPGLPAPPTVARLDAEPATAAPAPPPAVARVQLAERELMPAALPPRTPIGLPPLPGLAAPAVPPTLPSPEAAPVIAAPPPQPAQPPAVLAVAPALPATTAAVAAAPTSFAAALAPMLVTAVVLPPPAPAAGRAPATAVIPAPRIMAEPMPAAEPIVAAPAAQAIIAAPAAQPIVTAPAAQPIIAQTATPMIVTAVLLPATAASSARMSPQPMARLAATTPPATADIADDRRIAGQGEAFTVQVGALPSESAAQAYWSALSLQLPQVFDGRSPEIFRADLPQGAVWRLRTGGFANAVDARGFCVTLRNQGRDCWVPAN